MYPARSVTVSLIFSSFTLAIALSVFFYVRSRESSWDNRSGTSRLIAISHNRQVGTEIFNMFGSGGIVTLNGTARDEITDENTLHILDTGRYLMDLHGLTATTVLTGTIYINRAKLVPIQGSILQQSDTQLEIQHPDANLAVQLVGSRLEIRSNVTVALRVCVTAWNSTE